MYTVDTTATGELRWRFPLPRPHTGLLLGNGLQGLMVWGTERLCVTIGRAGFWDHRGGNDFTARIDFQGVRRLLEAGDEAGLRQAFGLEGGGDQRRPHQIGGGRLEIDLPPTWRLESGVLDVRQGIITVLCQDGQGSEEAITIRQLVEHELTRIDLPSSWPEPSWRLRSSAELLGGRLERDGFSPPVWSDDGHAFVQPTPEDEALAVMVRTGPGHLALATALAQEPAAQAAAALALSADLAAWQDRDAWWQAYWEAVPTISLDDPVAQDVVTYGLYKQACASPPHALACTLQGPFLEDYQLPPWSCDYHFNINIQMIMWPALTSNRVAHCQPLWYLLQGWWPHLQANGSTFFGDPAAIMLPHAVDDRCQVVGAFWTGTIDQACTAWVAQLAWLHYRYSLDEDHLRRIAWPMLNGAFAGFWAMLEEGADGGLHLPVSVNPEYGGCDMQAWGADASFQLAAIHMLARTLTVAAEVLGEASDPRWQAVRDHLPLYSTVRGPRNAEHPHGVQDERIALWQGQDLEESHRHHSHLGGIYPFAVIDPDDPAHRPVIEASLHHWVRRGPGAWSGWSVPWAAIIHARVGHGDAALTWLYLWHRLFVNQGRGTLHDAAFPGVSTLAQHNGRAGSEVMQLDAGFGALQAVFELLVQQRGEALHVLPCRPEAWRDVDCDGLLCEGAFVLGFSMRDGIVHEIRIHSRGAQTLRVAHGLGDGCLVDGCRHEGAVLVRDCQPGQNLVLQRSSS